MDQNCTPCRVTSEIQLAANCGSLLFRFIYDFIFKFLERMQCLKVKHYKIRF